MTSVMFSEYTEKETRTLSSHTHFMKPHPEPLKTQHISRSLSVVISIGHLTFYKHYHKQVQNSISSDEMLKHKTNNYIDTYMYVK